MDSKTPETPTFLQYRAEHNGKAGKTVPVLNRRNAVRKDTDFLHGGIALIGHACAEKKRRRHNRQSFAILTPSASSSIVSQS